MKILEFLVGVFYDAVNNWNCITPNCMIIGEYWLIKDNKEALRVRLRYFMILPITVYIS
jgi:hypothetical protein